MLVESPDGHRALLGRSRKFMPGMYTCLSGFIDQCEAVEEVRCLFVVCVFLAAYAMPKMFQYPWLVVASLVQAVRREVREEAHVSVAEVQIMGTQPWPIGRWVREVL
jgi:NAD+ diphosphatase